MRTGKIVSLAMIIVCCLSLLSAAASPDTPKESIRVTVEAVLDVLRDKKMSAPDKKKERRETIRKLIKDRFDFREMSMRSLATHWKERTPAETKEFVEIFSDLLVASYIRKIEAYTDEKVVYGKEVLKGNGRYGVVSTTIISKEVDIPIDYKVILKDGKWWVYDVVIEGVSFISTYNTQYNEIIIKESYAGLIKKMKDKLDSVNAE